MTTASSRLGRHKTMADRRAEAVGDDDGGVEWTAALNQVTP